MPRTPSYSISSTLNPQAPEFILSCTTSKKLPDDIDKEVNYSSANCQYPGSALALDGGSHAEAEALENDGVSGGHGKRELKKKKAPCISGRPLTCREISQDRKGASEAQRAQH